MTNEITSFYSPKKTNANFHTMQEKLDLFVNYSATMLLKIYNIILHETNQNNYDFNLRRFENVMDYLKNNKIENNPTLLVYYYIILLETEKSDKYFYELKKLRKKTKINSALTITILFTFIWMAIALHHIMYTQELIF